MSNLAQELAEYTAETDYDDLPPNVVHETKRILLDSIGCALAALTTDKAKMTVALAKRFGGAPESSIIGTGYKVSCSSAVLANGELMNCIDYGVLITPGAHVPPHVLPPILALAEQTGASGKELILATALGYEIVARVSRGLPSFYHMGGAGGREMIFADRYGHAASNFGAAAGAGKILKFDRDKMFHALGIAGHLCQVPTHVRFSFATPRPLAKYGMPGWQSTGALMATLLAEMGYTGDSTIFDSEHGFWKFAGFASWAPEKVTENLRDGWYLLNVQYKPYPCCRMLHTALDCFFSIIDQNDLRPEEMESVTAFCHPTVNVPCFTNPEIESIVDAQFNPAYVFSVAAHRIRVGIEWQDTSTMRDPKILEFMSKVSFRGHPDYAKQRAKDPTSSVGAAEVVAKGQIFREERTHPKGSPGTDLQLTDEELVAKFRHNASRALTQKKIDRAVETLLDLEKVNSISELFSCLTPVSLTLPT